MVDHSLCTGLQGINVLGCSVLVELCALRSALLVYKNMDTISSKLSFVSVTAYVIKRQLQLIYGCRHYAAV